MRDFSDVSISQFIWNSSVKHEQLSACTLLKFLFDILKPETTNYESIQSNGQKIQVNSSLYRFEN